MQYDTNHAIYQNSRASRIKKLEKLRYEHLLESNSLHKRIIKLAIFEQLVKKGSIGGSKYRTTNSATYLFCSLGLTVPT